jgi:hypothetical protein
MTMPQGYRPPRITGFVNFANIPEALAQNAQNDPGHGLWSVLTDRRGRPISFWSDLKNWAVEISWIETNLATRLYRAAGINEITGEMVWIEPEAWRRPFPVQDGEMRTVKAALLGHAIPVDSPNGLLSVYPMLRIRDLARTFGADFPALPTTPPNDLLYLWQPPLRPPPLPSAPPQHVLDQIQEPGGRPQSAPEAKNDLEPLTAALEGCFESEGKFNDLPEEVQARVKRIRGSAIFIQFWDVISPGQKRRTLAQQFDSPHAEAVLRQKVRSLGLVWPEDATWITPENVPGESGPDTEKPRISTGEALLAKASGVDAPGPGRLPALADKIHEWHEIWANDHPLASDKEALEAAKLEFPEEKISRRSVGAMRRLPDGAHRPRGRKAGKSESEFH